MAKNNSLDLSVLQGGVEYPLTSDIHDGKCLIHVKLTEKCGKAIDNLISSNKGAVFSLWFTENGGHLTMPSVGGIGMHKFQFSTAALIKREQNSSLECLHQLIGPDKQQLVSSLGSVEHKLTVKATDDVYETTKIRATQLEKERQGIRAKEIRIPKVRKNKAAQLSNTSRTPHKSSFVMDSSSNNKAFSGTVSKPSHSGTGGVLNKTPSNYGRSPKTLKERIIYMLALKPLRRPDIVLKLKKATKRSESAIGNLDSLLSEVSTFYDSNYHLKDQFYSELDVDSWPFYNDAEKALIRRKLLSRPVMSDSSSTTSGSVTMTTNLKRSSEETPTNHQYPLKRPKLSETLPTNTLDSAHSLLNMPHSSTPETKHSQQPVKQVSETSHTEHQSHIKTEQHIEKLHSASKFISTRYISEEPLIQRPVVSESCDIKAPDQSCDTKSGLNLLQEIKQSSTEEERLSHKHKKKKKKHKHRNVDSLSHGMSHDTHESGIEQSHDIKPEIQNDRHDLKPVDDNNDTKTKESPQDTSDLSSTQIIPTDLSKKFPPITSTQQRTEYKILFNEEYKEYVSLKDKMDSIQDEVISLTTQLSSLPRHSKEIKEVRSKIKKKYIEMQQDTHYQNDRKRLYELHYKLEHIKKMVIQYDNTHN